MGRDFDETIPPNTLKKLDGLRLEAEGHLLPNLKCFIEDLDKWVFSNPGDNALCNRKLQLESTFAACLGLTADFASSMLETTDHLNSVHSYARSSNVPYKRVSGVPAGTGSFGIVYQALEMSSGCFRAIKQLNKINSLEDRRKVQKELSMLRRCDHLNIIKLLHAYQLDDDPSTFFLVTDPWAPYTLGRFILQSDSERERQFSWFNPNSVRTERYIVQIFRGLADGLRYLHNQSIKHKDLKPDNILLHHTDYGIVRPIIADLGISKIFKVGNPTDYVKSTYAYLAPEQINKVGSTLKSDVWQMGCCFALTLAVFRGGSKGCNQLWNSFEYTDGNCSCNIALEAVQFMNIFDKICGEGSASHRHAYWIITVMLEVDPAMRFSIETVERELSDLISTI